MMKYIKNTQRVTKLLVAPPTSRVHSLKSHHELNKVNPPLKLENTVLAQFRQCKISKWRKNEFVSNTLALLLG
jgi:hypothetical protein